MPGYRFIEHTADAGIEIDAPTPTDVYRLALEAFTDSLTIVERVEPRQAQSITVRASGLDLLLVEWLQELLYRFETKKFLARRGRLQLECENDTDFNLDGEILGESFDPSRHPLKLPIKAITYHQLVFEPSAQGYRAQVIFDV